MPIDNSARLRLEHGATYLHSLGPRATFEFLAELSAPIGGMPACLGLLAEYQARLTPEIVRAAGADRMPSRPLRKVPQ